MTDLDLSKTYSMTFDVVNPDALNLLFGQIEQPPEQKPVSMIFDRTYEVPDIPDMPTYRPKSGWYQRYVLRNREAWRVYRWEMAQYDADLIKWQANGCPNKTMTERTYIPNARLTEVRG